jgi:hypothetical protein
VDDADAKKNQNGPLFSVSSKEDAYEVDPSFLEHGIKVSPLTNSAHLSPPHSRQGSAKEDLINASTIAQPASMQHDNCMDDDMDKTLSCTQLSPRVDVMLNSFLRIQTRWT